MSYDENGMWINDVNPNQQLYQQYGQYYNIPAAGNWLGGWVGPGMNLTPVYGTQQLPSWTDQESGQSGGGNYPIVNYSVDPSQIPQAPTMPALTPGMMSTIQAPYNTNNLTPWRVLSQPTWNQGSEGGQGNWETGMIPDQLAGYQGNWDVGQLASNGNDAWGYEYNPQSGQWEPFHRDIGASSSNFLDRFAPYIGAAAFATAAALAGQEEAIPEILAAEGGTEGGAAASAGYTLGQAGGVGDILSGQLGAQAVTPELSSITAPALAGAATEVPTLSIQDILGYDPNAPAPPMAASPSPVPGSTGLMTLPTETGGVSPEGGGALTPANDYTPPDYMTNVNGQQALIYESPEYQNLANEFGVYGANGMAPITAAEYAQSGEYEEAIKKAAADYMQSKGISTGLKYLGGLLGGAAAKQLTGSANASTPAITPYRATNFGQLQVQKPQVMKPFSQEMSPSQGTYGKSTLSSPTVTTGLNANAAALLKTIEQNNPLYKSLYQNFA